MTLTGDSQQRVTWIRPARFSLVFMLFCLVVFIASLFTYQNYASHHLTGVFTPFF